MIHQRIRSRAAFAVIALFLVLPASLQAAPKDARTDYIDTTYTYNLGPTGARGWIHSDGNEWMFTPEGLTTQSRQILVTRVEAGSPAAGILQVNDVILGANGTTADPVDFTSDARKSLGLAIGEAEKTANAGALKLKIWRSGVTQNVQLTLQVMGTYSATAPFSCPKSAAIITKACTRLASRSINSGYTEGNAVIGLALLACVVPTDPYYATVQSKVQAYARSIAPQDLHLTIPVNQMVAWPWGYTNVFLSEYYLATGDTYVLPAIREYTATCARGQSLFGTYGHGMAWSKSDGSSTHGYVPPYGALNQAGETVNLGIMLGRKAIAMAGDATVDPEIEPAIERGRKYFAYFAGKGAVPYGHSPPEDLHDDNGKSGLASLLMALQTQADMSTQAQQFAKSCTAAYSLREMGHCGPYWAHLWQPLGVNVGGPTAMAAYFKEIQWELDLVRRWDGGFAYHSATGAAADPMDPANDAKGLGTDSDTASFLLTYATALKKIYITGKNQNTANYISAGDIDEAITDGVYSLHTDLTTKTSDQLVAFLNSWSPQRRNWAAAELATRSDAATKVATLLIMAADLTNLNARKGACQALGPLKPKLSAAQLLSVSSALNARLDDTDYHVRYYAAEALRALGSGAVSVLPAMLSKIVANAVPIEPSHDMFNEADPYQMAYIYLGSAAFEAQLNNSSAVNGVSTSLLYPAITTMAQSLGRGTLAETFRNGLSLTNVRALAPVITTGLLNDHAICSAGLANACVSVLSKYNIDEGIPAAMTFLNQEYGRAWPTDSNTCQEALRKYGSTASATLSALDYWKSNGVDLAATIAAIENDTTSHTLEYFKTISTCTANPSPVTLPAGSTLLSAAAADIDGNGASLVYSWSKVRGAGAVTFSTNGTTTSNNTIATFDTPGTYVIRLGVTDDVLDPNKYGPVTRDLTITVLADPNRPPVALNQNITTTLDTAKAITLAAIDADVGNILTYSVVSGPASGSLGGTPPALTYTPALGFTGTTSFTFKANDGTVDSSIATVTIAVGLSGNITPVAQNQVLTTVEDTVKAITLAGTDADGNPLTYNIVSPPAHGTVTAGTAASRTYTPVSNYNGMDSFTFTVNDGTATSATATVVISVTAVNDAPVAIAQSLSTPEDTAIPITLSGTDPEGYAITYQRTGTPTHGTLSGFLPNLTYTPASLYNGSDSFTFTVTDSEGMVSAAATVSITVTPVNQAPVALNRSLPVTISTATPIVLSGTDADNNPLTYTVLSQPAHGALTGTVPNLSYTPVTGYDSTDSFTFKVNDGTVDSNIATVYLSMGVIYTGVNSEFYQNPPNLYSWPDMAHLAPSDTRLDTQISFNHADFPANYEDHFSSRHTGYIKITTAGYYTFSTSADDNTRVFVDETYVLWTIYGQAGWSIGPRYLTAGYHAIRVEFVETYGDNYLHLNWSGPSGSGTVPASAFFRCVGSTAPVVPANLTATPLDSAVALTWSLSPFATGYTVQRSQVAGGPYDDFAAVLTTTSYRDTTVTNGTTYYYVVTATGAGGTSFASNEAGATPVTAPVTVNLDYHGGSILMNGSASNSEADRGSASRVAPLDYDGTNAAAAAVNFWNAGANGTSALSNMKNSEGVATTIGVSALLVAHGDANDWGGLGVAPNGAKLLKGGLQLSQSPNLLSYKTLFKLTGLNTSHNYELVLASQHNTDERSTSYRVGLVQDTVANGGTATDWSNGLNYAVLDSLIPNSAGQIHVQAMVNSDWAPLNGWQLLDKGVRTAGANSYTTIDSCNFGALGAATITDSNITLTVPYGTALGALTPTLVAAAGATISPSTAQNFVSPVIYRVTAENGGNYQDYTVTITVAPNVTFTTTALAVTAASSGAEILSTGTLVAANHFYSTAATVTLANGLTFGTDWRHTTPTGLSASHQRTDTDTHGHVPLLNGSTAFGKLMRSYAWSSETNHYLNIPGLTPGHTYRLQLISSDAASAGVSVEQAGAPALWSGNNKLLTAVWTQGAGDYVANVVLTRTGNPELETTAYALHDVTTGFQPSPTGLVATAGDGQISLRWDVAPGATGYTVKRSLTTGGPYTTAGNPTGTTYLNTSLTNGIRYYYVVSATTALGETPDSAQASAIPSLPPAPPAPPANLVATAGSNTVGLTWDASSGALGYTVKRSTTSGGPYTTLGNPGGTSYNNTPVTNGTTYYYVVSATNGAGEGANSSQVSAVPTALTSTTTLASSLGTTGTYGTAVTFTATVTSVASGTVTFKEGASLLGTGTLSAGQATYSTNALALGAHSITASYGGDATYAASNSAAFSYSVTAKTLTVTGTTVTPKTYDGSTTAALAGGTLVGVVGGDAVSLVASGTFNTKDVGTGKVVTSTSTLAGAQKDNYTLTQPGGLTGTITALVVALSGSRTYDGTTNVAAASLATGNKVSGDDLSLSGSASLAAKNAGAQNIVFNHVTPVRVRSATGNTGASAATTIAVNMVTAPATGNTMIAVISTRGTSSGRVTSITQTGAAWTRAAQTVGTAGTTTEIWYAPNVSGAAATVTINQSSLLSAAVVMEYSGILAVSPLDKTANATGNSTAAATGTTAATTQAIELWIGGIGLVNSSYTLGTPNNSFTAVASAQSTHTTAASNAKVYALERIVTATGAASSSATITSSQWSGAMATFRAASTLTLGGTAAANYTLIGATGAVTITPATLTITANNQSKTYGQSVTFGSGSTQFTSSGLQHGETIGSVTLTCDGGGAAAAVAPYPITPGAATAGTFSAGNYAISYVPGTLTVNPASFATWALDPAQGLNPGVNDGPLQDPDHDGISNLLEFTLGGAPMVSSQAILPVLTKHADAWIFEYERSDLSKSATTQIVEYGDNLTGWTQIPIPAVSNSVVTVTPGTSSDHVQVIIPVPGGKVFARLKVTQ